ncbi:diacylglycerol kinase family protein [Dehalobacter sp. DCM]|uniref:diacylglycerol kinase family protein n=1 Tax=Dehalobacter sp. DCM TaxID=2907827 RepID=UPI003082105E|nr:diacylglycerol kinase family protein [Dehalobacter sp. DCM]
MADTRKNTDFSMSFKAAGNGIIYTLKTEKHMKFHVFAAAAVVLAGLFFHLSTVHWLFLVYAIGSVVVAELFNTAIERAIDLAEPNYNSLAGIGKDIASGAVLVTALQAVIIGIIIFGPNMIRLF